MHYIICNKVCSRRLHLNVTCTHSFYVNQYANCIDNSAKRIRRERERERVRARTRTHAHVLSYKIHHTHQRTVKTTKRKIMIKFVRVWIRIRIDLHISPRTAYTVHTALGWYVTDVIVTCCMHISLFLVSYARRNCIEVFMYIYIDRAYMQNWILRILCVIEVFSSEKKHMYV